MRRSLIVLALLVAAAMTAAVAADKVKDNFNDNVQADFWSVDENRIEVREKNERLEFRSHETGPGLRESGYVGQGWRLDYTQNYTIRFKFNMGVTQVTGNRMAFVGVRALPNGEFDEVSILIQFDAGGVWLLYEAYRNGALDTQQMVALADRTGTVKVKYISDADRLDISVDGAVLISIDDLLAGVDTGNGRARITIGAARQGFVDWGWSDVWVDNLVVKGTIID